MALKQIGSFKYFKHQEVAIRWMLDIEKEGVYFDGEEIHEGILADDMGLGKTIEICGLIKNNPLPENLILCPIALIDNWYTNMSKAGFNVLILEDCWRLYDRKVKDPEQPSIYIANYEKLVGSKDEFIMERFWDRVIMDEAHKIRNPNSKTTQAAYKIDAFYKWAVTGTPIVNSMTDAASLLKWLGVQMPTKINRNGVEEECVVWKNTFNSILPLIVLQRTMNEIRNVLRDAPPKPLIEDVIIPFECEEEAEFYRGIQDQIADLFEKYKHDRGMELLELLMRLRQISVHPQVYINGRKKSLGKYYKSRIWEHKVSKFEEVRRIIEKENKGLDAADKHKYLFICHFKDEMDILSRYLVDNGLVDKCYIYSGDLNKSARDDVIAKAKKTPNCALCLQLQAGGVGLNLQEFDRVIFLSPWWNAAIMDQAIARAVRMGQKKIVKVYNIRLEEEITLNIDDFIHERVEIKKELAVEFFKAVRV